MQFTTLLPVIFIFSHSVFRPALRSERTQTLSHGNVTSRVSRRTHRPTGDPKHVPELGRSYYCSFVKQVEIFQLFLSVNHLFLCLVEESPLSWRTKENTFKVKERNLSQTLLNSRASRVRSFERYVHLNSTYNKDFRDIKTCCFISCHYQTCQCLRISVQK